MQVEFTKMEGAGNDFIFLTPGSPICLFSEQTNKWKILVKQLCDRHKGVGANGVVVLTKKSSWTMDIYNSDGSLAGMCGNATRCAALYLKKKENYAGNILPLETSDGIKDVTILPGKSGNLFQARVNLGFPRLAPKDIPVRLKGENVLNRAMTLQGETFIISTVSMGNPHCILFADAQEASFPGIDILDDDFFLTWGPLLEQHSLFPDRCNVEFVQVISPSEVKARVWERGCGETQACGTGAAAVCAAGRETGRLENKIICHMPGGDLFLERTDRGIFKTGPASLVFEGIMDIDL